MVTFNFCKCVLVVMVPGLCHDAAAIMLEAYLYGSPLASLSFFSYITCRLGTALLSRPSSGELIFPF